MRERQRERGGRVGGGGGRREGEGNRRTIKLILCYITAIVKESR